MERQRIVALLQDYADAALGAGEQDIAMRLTIIIGNVVMAVDDDEVIVTDGPPGETVEEMLARVEQQEKRDFDQELGGGELPRVQFNSDDEDAQRLLRAHPRMNTVGFARD